MKKYIFVVFLLICKISFCQYIIPNASQQPKWCFPLFIEEGSGKKDTVYLAYDPNAHPLFGYGELDTLFGEKPLTLDTTKFNSYLEHPHSLYYSIYDTLYKVKAEVSSDFYFPCITVINGVFPVKIKWDLHQFYSDSLPFPSKYPLPNGQGNLGLLFPIIPVNSDCESQFPILVSDTGNYYNCMVKDSIIVKSYSGNNQFTKFKFYFSVEPWTGITSGFEGCKEKDLLFIWPNPIGASYRKIHIVNNTGISKETNISIYDLQGKKVMTEQFHNQEVMILDVSLLSLGLYIIKLQSENIIVVRKLVLQ